MSAYVKISYPSEKYNYAMRECIKFIGEHFGRSGRNPYKEGKRIIAKKVRGLQELLSTKWFIRKI